MDTKHRIDISILNDFYGVLLTKHQSEMIRLYYDRDVSLNEIANEYSISRQAVRDAIMRGEKALSDFESKLHYVERNNLVLDKLATLRDVASSDEERDKIDELIDIVEGE